MVLLRRVIGDALRARRQAQHRTLREVSMAANVSLGYLSEIERGQKEASSELLASICEALGARLSELLGDLSHAVAGVEQREGGLAMVPAVVEPTRQTGEPVREPAQVGAQSRELVGAGAGQSGESGSAATERQSAAAAPTASIARTAALLPVAMAQSPRPATTTAGSVSTTVDGDIAVTVRQDTALRATLRTRTIRRDILSSAA